MNEHDINIKLSIENDLSEIFELQLDNNLNINLINATLEDTSGLKDVVGMPGAYYTHYGNKDKLLIPDIIQPWRNIKSVLDRIDFKAAGSSHIDTIESIINKSSEKGIKSTLFDAENKQNSISEVVIYNVEDGVYIDNTVEAILYTKALLYKGMPVVFGVNCLPYPEEIGTGDASTNHYIIIVGMGNDGRNYFYAWDIACRYPYSYIENEVVYDGGIYSENKIYLDGIWPGLLRADKTWGSPYSKARQAYKVTKVIKTFVK